ncbi:MAG: recombinase family protein [Actinobacteria bacterium]|nr:recombinase family protein [Actinomycetota bacterium]
MDRLARNRFDDAQINMAIQQSGSSLVSVTDKVDETPSGMFMQDMSGINRVLQRNLATESREGMWPSKPSESAAGHWARSRNLDP